MLLRDAIAAYLQSLAVERRAPATSLAAARQDLALLQADADAAGRLLLSQVQSATLRALLAARRRAGMGPATQRRELSSWRSFLRHAQRHAWVVNNPALGIKGPRLPRKLPGVFEKDPLNAALNAAPDDALTSVRAHAIAELLYGAGLRLAELAGLHWSDIDEGQLRVTGKGARMRILPLGSKAQAALTAWAAAAQQHGLPVAGPVFQARAGVALSRSSIAADLKRWAAAQGLAGRVHPHRFRHAYATHLLEESGDLRAVQELLGHQNLSTTQIYTHLDFERLVRVYDHSHPRAKIFSKNVATQQKKAAKISV